MPQAVDPALHSRHERSNDKSSGLYSIVVKSDQKLTYTRRHNIEEWLYINLDAILKCSKHFSNLAFRSAFCTERLFFISKHAIYLELEFGAAFIGLPRCGSLQIFLELGHHRD